MVVDDYEGMRRLIVQCLRAAGVPIGQVLEAENGREALVVLRDSPVDLILCDINMPLMDGLDLLRALRQRPATQNTPVVIITADGGESRVVAAIKAGAGGYLCKPFSPEQVKERVLPLLSGLV
jgi:two-component system chemotaxis response regulator CheY